MDFCVIMFSNLLMRTLTEVWFKEVGQLIRSKAGKVTSQLMSHYLGTITIKM
jgi:hypothetical protein